MKRTFKNIVSIILAVAMVFSLVNWNALAFAENETSGAWDVEAMSQSGQVKTSKTSLGSSATAEDTTTEVFETPMAESVAMETQAAEAVGNAVAMDVDVNPVLSLDDGNITLNVGTDSLTYTQGEVIDQPYSGTVTLTQDHSEQEITTSVTINDRPTSGTSIQDDTAYVKLEGINTQGEFKIVDRCKRDVVVTLANNEHNILSSGLEKTGDDTSGHLTIQAEEGAIENNWGSLKATSGRQLVAGIGGFYNDGSNITISGGTVVATGLEAAGIGGGGYGSGSNITITGGNVTATGGSYAAGIGGGHSRAGTYITISGGTVKATGKGNAAGIGGGGDDGSASNITISGGTVTAAGDGGGAGIGGGNNASASNITISGGTVTAAGDGGGAAIGGGLNGICEGFYISGGSVNASGGDGQSPIGDTPVVSADDPTPVYRTELTFNNGAPVAKTAVSQLTSTYSTYNLKDAATDAAGKFYGYFPENTSTTAATLDGITEEFKPESEAVITTADNKVSATLYTPFDITTVSQPSEGGTVSVTGETKARVGDTVTLNNEPAEGYSFQGYTVINNTTQEEITVNKDGTFIMPASDVEVTAEFRSKNPHAINIASSEYGIVTSNVIEARAGETVTLTVQANAGYALIDGSLKTNGQVVQKEEGTGNYTFVMPDEDVTVTAEYGPEELNIIGGVMGTNYQYDPTNKVVTVTTSTGMTLSNRESGKPAQTRIVVETSDANLALAGVNIDVSAKSAAGIELTSSCTGNVELTVIGENTIQGGAGKAGVQKAGSGTLKIQGTAAEGNVLTATGGEGGAGIGSEAGQNVENIVIENVGIKATAGEMAAGIGGGYGASAENVKVTGSSIEISCSESGAGIGGGVLGYLENGTVENSRVIVTGHGGGAGIGGGQYQSGTDIRITGGSITVKGREKGFGGAGIGGGAYGGSKGITVNGGTVEVEGSNNGAGIGSGAYANTEEIEIGEGSEIIAQGGEGGAGIGGGFQGSGTGIIISNGNVKAEGGKGGAGIGGGSIGNGGEIQIKGGVVDAEGGVGANDGIGNGSQTSGQASVKVDGGNVKINKMSSVVKNSKETSVYQTKIILKGAQAQSEISGIETTAVAKYGTTGMKSYTEGEEEVVYVYLPEGTETTGVTTAAGTTYTGTVTTTADGKASGEFTASNEVVEEEQVLEEGVKETREADSAREADALGEEVAEEIAGVMEGQKEEETEQNRIERVKGKEEEGEEGEQTVQSVGEEEQENWLELETKVSQGVFGIAVSEISVR